MKPHDKRRLNAFILDEKKAAEEYHQMGVVMEENGYFEHAEIFYNLAVDEMKHSERIRYIIANSP